MVGTHDPPQRPLFLVLFLLLSAAALFGEEDLRDAEGGFYHPSVGVWGRFDRIHVRNPGAVSPVNTILTCFGWGLCADWSFFAVKAGLRSQLGTSSLDPGYADDEQLVATAEIQAKVPLLWGRLGKVFPTLGLEYGTRLSGTVRDGDSYSPVLVRLGLGGDIEVTDKVYLRVEASSAWKPAWGTGRASTTFFTLTQTVGYRLP